YSLDERVQLRPEWLPNSVQTLKVWLTNQTGYDLAMLNKRYIVHLSGNGSSIRLSNCTIEHKDYGQPDFVLTSLPMNFTGTSNPIVFNTDEFANLRVTWEMDEASGAMKIFTFIEGQLLGGCFDSDYRIAVSRVGYSGLQVPTDPYATAEASPQVWFNQTDSSTMGAFSPSLLSYLTDGPSSTSKVFIQVNA
uniref:CUB domain-containing protein n=1 Tax=Macrostomum lignano TaxID=282301 RepID=A0A1I8GUS6_9PLAT